MHAILHKVLRKLNISNFSAQPFQSALYQQSIQVVRNQTQLLTAGKVHQSLLKHMGINQPVFFADIAWDVLLCQWKRLTQFQEISKFPSVKRDISLVLHQSVNFEAVSRVITEQNNKLIKDVTAFDVYQGEKLGKDKKAYALSVVLQRKDKTLDEKTIEQVMTRLMRAFEDQLGAMIRE
jgi:phenylalanyl-tRNA synthetase beta chain